MSDVPQTPPSPNNDSPPAPTNPPPPTETPGSTTTPTTPSTENSPSPADKQTKESLGAEAKGEDKPATPAGAPEKYEAFKAPEGYELNEKAVGEFSTLAKELNLSQEGAQRLVDMYVAQQKANAEEPFAAYDKMRDDWRSEIINDRALGNGKDNLNDATRAAIGRVKDALPQSERVAFEEAMNLTGAGDNPAFIRAMVAWSRALTEGGSVTGSPPAAKPAKPSAAQAIYPGLASGQ